MYMWVLVHASPSIGEVEIFSAGRGLGIEPGKEDLMRGLIESAIDNLAESIEGREEDGCEFVADDKKRLALLRDTSQTLFTRFTEAVNYFDESDESYALIRLGNEEIRVVDPYKKQDAESDDIFH